MIPYEELVVALQAWRAKQGLPISQMSGQLAMPAVQAAVAPAATARSAPPAAPPKPPPRGDSHHEEVDLDAGMLEEAYEPAGDFAMRFDDNSDGEDATAIGGAPQPPPEPRGRGGGGKKGW
jgi:hypothetical protein